MSDFKEQRPPISELRGFSIAKCVEYLSKYRTDQEVSIFEIGSAFSPTQGISTLQFAEYASNNPKVSFATVDIDPSHTELSKSVIRSYANENTLSSVRYFTCDSICALESLRNKGVKLDFVYIDGGNDPVQNLKEFKLVHSMLKPEGFVLVDDLQEIRGADYFLPRPFGKATLIIPYLILSKHREILKLDSVFQGVNGAALPEVHNFYVQIRMLAYGPEHFLNFYKSEISKSETKDGIHFPPS